VELMRHIIPQLQIADVLSVNIGKRLISDRLSSCPWSRKLGLKA